MRLHPSDRLSLDWKGFVWVFRYHSAGAVAPRRGVMEDDSRIRARGVILPSVFAYLVMLAQVDQPFRVALVFYCSDAFGS